MCRRQVLRACAVTVAGVVLALVIGSGSAAAHAELISTDPGQDAVVATIPSTVALTFSEPVAVAADGVRVFSPDGVQVDNGDTVHLGRSSTVGVGLRSSQEQPTPAQQGTYTVSWRVVSADSHPVTGAFAFSVGHPSRSQAPEAVRSSGSTTVGVAYAFVRAAAFASYALLVGSIGFVLLCWPAAIAGRGIRRIMLVGWAGLLATTMAALLLQGPYGNGLGLDRLFGLGVFSGTLDSRLGTALTARLALLALVGGYLVLLCAWLGHAGRRGRGSFRAVGLTLALGLALTWATANHAAVGPQPALAIPMDAVHLLAMGVWLGGLVSLAVVLRPPGATATAQNRFSAIATGAIVVLIGTGGYQSWRQLGSWDAFWSTDYGRLLLAKLGVIAALLVAALLSRRATRERETVSWHRMPLTTSPSTLRRSVLGEVLLGALALGVTALLVNAEPGRTATAAPAHLVVSFDTGGSGGQGQLIVDVNPAATGPNTIHVAVQNSRGDPYDVAELDATVTLTSQTLASRRLGPFPVPLQRTGPNGYVADGFQLPMRGTWMFEATVRTSDIDRTTVVTSIEIR